MANERITEELIRSKLRALDYYNSENDVVVEEQKSSILAIKKALKTASKSGSGKAGYPEFIITSPENNDFVIIVECKSEVKYHASKNLDSPIQYAVDGILHYSKFLAKDFNVIGIAASGQTESGLKISAFVQTKGEMSAKPLLTKDKKEIDRLIRWEDFIEHASFDPSIQKMRFNELMAFSRELHDFMRDHAKLTESEKPLLVSGTLIALYNKGFAKSYNVFKPEELQRQWLHYISEEINKAKIPNSKKQNMIQPYSSISVHPELGKSTKAYPKGVLHELISMLNEKVWPFISIYHDFDIVGQFYGEFLKYTGGDKKALGIVLTPRHITELFTLLANVNKDSVVLDLCCGTGGFLIASMNAMIKDAVTSEEKEKIKKDGLIGVEQQPNMYALAASNMILRGDGKANLYQGSCFEPAIIKDIKSRNCSVGMINPPYSQQDEDLHELVFVRDMLNCLNENGVGIAIVPITCATSPHPLKEEILKYHTLDAVLSMPGDLFYPVGTVTCIMVFTAHKPHKTTNKKTWFGYCRDDGFVKTKHLGRIDLYNKWPEIRDKWVDAYRERDEVPGLSVKVNVDASDEWCAEAYLDTDYSNLSEKDFVEELQKYAVFRMVNGLDAKDVEEVEDKLDD